MKKLEKTIQKKLTLLVFALVFALAAMGAVSAADNSSDNLTATSADQAISTQDIPQTTVTSTDSNPVNQSTATAPEQLQIPDPYNTRTGISYVTIQAAISDPLTVNGDTIWVQPGTYPESVTVNKRLTIIPWPGMLGTVTIDVSGIPQSSGFLITAGGSGSTIQGFTITGAKDFAPNGNAGIRLQGASNVKILQNTILYNWAGIFLYPNALYNQIYDNFITNNYRHGIRIVDGSGYNEIYSNIITNNNLDNRANDGTTRYGGITYSSTAIGYDNIYLNMILGNLRNQLYDPDNTITAVNNWWGTNSSPSGISGATFNPWIILNLSAAPNNIFINEISIITADLTRNSANQDTTIIYPNKYIPNINILFNTNIGLLDGLPSVTKTTNLGKATATYTGTTVGTATISATVNSQTSTTNVIVNPKADVSMTKSGNGPLNVGQTGIFTITLQNNGPSTAQGVVVTDTLPAGFTAGTPSQGTYNGNTWTVGTLNNGATATLTFTRTMTNADAGTTKTNTASETQTTYDPTPITPQTATIYVNNAVLTITKTVTPTNYNVGDPVTYSLDVTNTGPDAATNVVVTDTVPTGLTYLSSTLGGIYNAGVITWNLANLAVNGHFTPSFTATVDTGTQGQDIANTASTHNDQNPTDVTSTPVNIHINNAPLTVTKTTDRSPSVYNVGENVIYTIDVINMIEGDTATGVVVTDSLPAGLTYVSSTLGGVWDPNTRIITWMVGDLASGAHFTPSVIATVTADAAAKTLENRAQSIDDQMEDPVSATASIYVPSADLVLTKTVDKTKPVVKDTVTFTLIVNNHGPDTAVDVTVNDKLPAGLTYVSSSANYGTYNPNTGIWTIGNLPNGETAILTIKAVVEKSGQITNQAKVSALTYDPNIEGNTASATLNVQAQKVPVNAQEKTIGMQRTGAPFGALIVALLMLFAGMVIPRRK